MPLRPVRKIRPGSRSITGKHSSRKTNTIHQFESSLERDFLILLEYDDTVEDYGVQPVTIHYELNGKAARYTPDIEVHYKPGLDKIPILYEIKYASELQEKQAYYAPRFVAATEYACVHGYEFKVFTEKNIRTDYLENIKFLSRYCESPVNGAYQSRIIKSFGNRKEITVHELLSEIIAEEKAKLLYTVWQMLGRKIIGCDIQKKLSMSSMIWNKQ